MINQSKLNNYLKGKGLQISKDTSFPLIPNIGTPLDNFFRLYDLAKEELDYIYTESIIGTTKYDRILYQEVLIALKKGGIFIVKYNKNGKDFAKKVKNEVLLVGKGKFSFEAKIKENDNAYLVFKKTKNYLKEGDNIDSWSFGIITNGTRDDFIEKFIKSVEQQNIPNYEVIICGKLGDESLVNKYENVRFIFFDQKSDKGWITKKKNLICEHAKYENLMVVHDRFYLDDNWFQGMKKYGNYFEVLCFEQIYREHIMGWTAYGGNASLKGDLLGRIRIVNKLHASDWSKYVCAHGGVSTLKKSIWKLAKWDEQRFWNEKDDVDLSLREYAKGMVIRLNPFSKVQVSHSRVGLEDVWLKKNPKKDSWYFWDGPIKEKLFFKIYLVKQCILALVYLIFKVDLFDKKVINRK